MSWPADSSVHHHHSEPEPGWMVSFWVADDGHLMAKHFRMDDGREYFEDLGVINP